MKLVALAYSISTDLLSRGLCAIGVHKDSAAAEFNGRLVAESTARSIKMHPSAAGRPPAGLSSSYWCCGRSAGGQ